MSATDVVYGRIGAYLTGADSAIRGGTAAAGSAMTAAQLAGLPTTQAASGARSSAATATGLAGGMAGAARSVQESARAVGQYVAPAVAGAERTAADAQRLRGESEVWSQTGADLLSGDKNASGLAGEWNRFLETISPASMASAAARTAQAAGENQRDQMMRTLTRMGVSAGSGAMAAALANAKRFTEATVAGAATRAREQGVAIQGEALQKGMSMAMSASGVGAQILGQAVETEGASVGMSKLAADIEGMKGSLMASSASIMQAAGNLVLGAGGLQIDAGRLSQSQAGLIADAARTVIAAQTTAAEYYSTQSSSILGLLQRNQRNVNSLASLFA